MAENHLVKKSPNDTPTDNVIITKGCSIGFIKMCSEVTEVIVS